MSKEIISYQNTNIFIMISTYLEHKEGRLSEEAIENYIGASFIIVIWQRLSLSIH